MEEKAKELDDSRNKLNERMTKAEDIKVDRADLKKLNADRDK